MDSRSPNHTIESRFHLFALINNLTPNPKKTIILEGKHMGVGKNQKDLFTDLSKWNESLIRLQKKKNLYKNFELKLVDDKLFQTRLYFPSNVPTGNYIATIYRIENKKILSSNEKIIKINKSGIGNKIFIFAQQNTIIYGFGTIIFAIIIIILGALKGSASIFFSFSSST